MKILWSFATKGFAYGKLYEKRGSKDPLPGYRAEDRYKTPGLKKKHHTHPTRVLKIKRKTVRRKQVRYT
jgi:hypothetical protein